MKKLHLVLASLVLITAGAASAAPAKSSDFKGASPSGELTVGALAGLSIIGTEGFGLIGNVGKRIVERGFAPDVNNQVYIEGQFGPVFGLAGTTGWHYSAHLRWDFPKDDQFTFYGLGGVGGSIVASTFRLHPRFGVGGFFYFDSYLAIRAELSHELIGAGISYRL